MVNVAILKFREKISLPLSKIVIFLFLLIGFIGVISPYKYNHINASPVIEMLFIFLSVSLIVPLDKGMIVFYAFSAFYIIYTFSKACVFSNVNFADYLQAYKAFFYVILLSPFVGSGLFNIKQMKNIFYVTVLFFLIKYSYSRLFNFDFLVGSRPGVYVENNFELVFLLLLFYLVFDYLKYKTFYIFAIFFIIVLSASRSSYLCTVVICLFSLMKMSKKSFITNAIIILLLIGIGAIIAVDRTESTTPVVTPQSSSFTENNSIIKELLMKGQSIDRVRFLTLFLDDTNGWTWDDYLLGTPALTPLSEKTCKSLAYWDELHSYAGDGRCYSVILHSYILRVIYDHGILGLVFLVLFSAIALYRSQYNWIDILCVLGVVLMSSLSVSAFNSIFYSFALMFYLGVKHNSCKHV